MRRSRERVAVAAPKIGSTMAAEPQAKIEKTDAEWRAQLTPEQYEILREAGTEAPFTGALLHNAESGVYSCAACGNALFKSDAKYDSRSGWPSFYETIVDGAVDLLDDDSLGTRRTEVRCGRCGSHLGHVFDDGPQPTGQRYCMNSCALGFKKQT
jgi:peptide-methionine (R)-S-oxide reductase